MKVQSDRPITYLVLQRTKAKKLLEEMLYVKTRPLRLLDGGARNGSIEAP